MTPHSAHLAGHSLAYAVIMQSCRVYAYMIANAVWKERVDTPAVGGITFGTMELSAASKAVERYFPLGPPQMAVDPT